MTTDHDPNPTAPEPRMAVARKHSLLPEEADHFIARLPEFAAAAQVSEYAAESMLAQCIKRNRASVDGYSFTISWSPWLVRGDAPVRPTPSAHSPF